MDICVFGCKSTTLHFLTYLEHKNYPYILVTIDPEMGERQKVADYTNLKRAKDISPQHIHIAQKYSLKSDEDINFFEKNAFDVGFSIGWQRLIPGEILNKFSTGVFGMHGSTQNLPYGRGRSPMNWSLIENRKWFFTNLFRYESGVDNGPIADTSCFSINASDTAETLHFKNLSAMIQLVDRNWDQLTSGKISLEAQNKGLGTLYPKRQESDGIIDWESPLFDVERLIRAVAPPFAGAFSYIGEEKITFLRASIFYTDLECHPFLGSQYGEICDVFPNNKFIVRCNGGVLIAHEWLGDPKVVKKGARLTSAKDDIVCFPRNQYGYFDV